jgi:hypothetical protein
MLTIATDGHKLPPSVIIRRKLSQKTNFCQERRWTTEKFILEFLNIVCKRKQAALLHKHAMLVLDSFRGRMTEKVKAETDKDSNLPVIPNAITKLLKTLDVVINWPFNIAFWWL